MVTRDEVKSKIKEVEIKLGRRLPNIRRKWNRLRGGETHLNTLMSELETLLTQNYTQVFTNSDYSSGDGIQTAVWGPCLWLFLHLSSVNYCPERKHGYVSLLYALRHMLPCGHCRNNFEKNYNMAVASMKKDGYHDVYESRVSYSKFIWYLHHHVNVMLGKNIANEPTFNQMRDQLETFRSRCITDDEIRTAILEKKEKGCTVPEYGASSKARCEVRFVPRTEDDLKIVRPLSIDPSCVCRKR